MKRFLAIFMTAICILAFMPNVSLVSRAADYISSWSTYTEGDTMVLTLKANNYEGWGYNMSYQNYPIIVNADGVDTVLTITWDATELKGPGWTSISGASITRADEADGQTVVVLSYFGDAGNVAVSFNNETRTIRSASVEETTETDTTEETSDEKTTEESSDSDSDLNKETTESETTESEATEESSTEESDDKTESTTTEEANDASSEETTEEVTTESTDEPVTAEGIVIDGDFSDWAGIAKSGFSGAGNGYSGVIASAMVFDGDVYIYLQDEGGYGNAAWSGPNSNGKYSIVTDLGYTLIFKLNNDGSSSGVDGITSARTGAEWEVKIPASAIPKNNGSINFGYYLAEPVFSEVQNLQETDTVPVGEISYDYSYVDWEGYKHTVIEYNTAGTSEDLVDSHAAIHLSGDAVLGHIVTGIPSHVNTRGKDVLYGVHLTVNDDDAKDIEFRAVAVDSQGNINWNPDKEGLANGSYEYYLFDVSCWGTSKNISDLNEHDICFGKAWVTVSDDSLEMEWTVDAKTLADYFDLNEDELYVLASSYRNIGHRVTATAGVSTGGALPAMLCMAVAAVIAGFVNAGKKRDKKGI